MKQVSSTTRAPDVFTVTLTDGTTVTHNYGAYIIAQPDGRDVRIQRSQVPAFLHFFLSLYGEFRGFVDFPDLPMRRTPDGLRIGSDADGVLIGRSQLDAFLNALIVVEL